MQTINDVVTAGLAKDARECRDCIADLLAMLREVSSYLADRSDVVDGDYGQPVPNAEMTLLREVDAAIAKATRADA